VATGEGGAIRKREPLGSLRVMRPPDASWKPENFYARGEPTLVSCECQPMLALGVRNNKRRTP
jgi:hypothetical protein